MSRDWCLETDKAIAFLGFRKNGKRFEYKKHYRCPDCGKRLKVWLRDCHDPGCVHLWISKHKVKKC